MFWNSKNNPRKSGPYLISVVPASAQSAMRGFLYVAYYEALEDQWYKQDPFTRKTNELISRATIAGWSDGLAIYLG